MKNHPKMKGGKFYNIYRTMDTSKHTVSLTRDLTNDTAYKSENRRKKISVELGQEQIFELMELLSKEFPHPKPALLFRNAYELLCAVVLSAQATDESVNKVTPSLFKKAPDPKHMVELGEDVIADIIKSIGLWRTKSRNLVKLSSKLLSEYKGEVPDNFKALLSLPGVGEKTANVILNVIFHHPTIAVDTHIFRVCKRTGLCVGPDALSVQHSLPSIIPAEHQMEAHHRLLYHGRFICKAQKPLCSKCVLNHLCIHKDDFCNSIHQL